MQEFELYARYRSAVENVGSIYRIENAVGSGMPDVLCCISGVVSLIENKIAKGGYLYFEKFQLPWHRKYLNSGGRVFVVSALPRDNRGFIMAMYNSSEVVTAPREPHKDMIRVATTGLTPIFFGSPDIAVSLLVEKLSQP